MIISFERYKRAKREIRDRELSDNMRKLAEDFGIHPDIMVPKAEIENMMAAWYQYLRLKGKEYP